MGYLWPFGVQGHLGLIRRTCLKMACNSKTAGRKSKWLVTQKRLAVKQNGVKFVTQGGVFFICIWGTFELLVFKVIWDHSVHFCQNGFQLENVWPLSEKN